MAIDESGKPGHPGRAHRLTRRDFVKYSAGAAATLSLGSFELGCGGARVEGYPISSDVFTTLERTIAFDKVTGLSPLELSQVSRYEQYGYGLWTLAGPLRSEPRNDLMPAGYVSPTRARKLLSFFAITDLHITDKESPSQAIWLQQLSARYAVITSIYSPVMLYTTHILDAAVQTINALHRRDPIDFGISLGDTCNSTQRNELRWYIDVLDGKVIRPSSGAHAGADTIDYQRPYKAAGLDKSIPWYQTLGNHDHLWLGSFPVSAALRESYVADTVVAAGDMIADPRNISTPAYYMGVIDGSTPDGDIVGAGPVAEFSAPPKVVPDPERRSLERTDWMKEFFDTSSSPAGHGFNRVDPGQEKGVACYSFVPKSAIPIKVIVLDDTQAATDGSPDFHAHGFLDQARYDWLRKELADGQAADQLMIIAAHAPIGVQPYRSGFEWWVPDAAALIPNAVTLEKLIADLQAAPNVILWIAGHRHVNTVKAFKAADAAHPEQGFWQVETSSLRDFPQQFRIFEVHLNSDYTVSIVTTNVDPAVKEGTPAARSRALAIAAQQMVNKHLNPIYKGSDPNLDPAHPPTALVDQNDPAVMTDPSIRPMPTGSYNAELFKQLSPAMVRKMKALFPTP